MGFIVVIIGLMVFVTAIRGTTGTLAKLVVSDVTGTNSFFYWLVAVAVIGGIGYIKQLKVLSDSFLVLLILALFLSNKGFFANFQSAVQQGTSTASATAANTPSSTSVLQSQQSNSSFVPQSSSGSGTTSSDQTTALLSSPSTLPSDINMDAGSGLDTGIMFA